MALKPLNGSLLAEDCDFGADAQTTLDWLQFGDRGHRRSTGAGAGSLP